MDREKVLSTLSQFANCFATSNLDLGKTDVIEFSIDTGDALPIYQFPLRAKSPITTHSSAGGKTGLKNSLP